MSYVLVDRPVPEVAVVTLNRPERMNAMAFDVMVPVRDQVRELGLDNRVRAIVLTGAGTGFCSGADQESAGTPPGAQGITQPTYALRAMEMLEDVVLTLRHLHQLRLLTGNFEEAVRARKEGRPAVFRDDR
jgi:enoyl-CoA hydratase